MVAFVDIFRLLGMMFLLLLPLVLLMRRPRLARRRQSTKPRMNTDIQAEGRHTITRISRRLSTDSGHGSGFRSRDFRVNPCSSVAGTFGVLPWLFISVFFRGPAQPSEHPQHLRIGEVRVSAARIGQHEDACAVNRRRAKSGRQRRRPHACTHVLVGVFRQQRLDDAKQRDPDERDNLRTILLYLPFENVPAVDVLGRCEIVDPWARPGNEVGDAKSKLGQARIVRIRNRLRHQSRVPQQLPEAIRETGEVMSGDGRPDARIDANKQHPQAWLDPVRQSQARPVVAIGLAVTYDSRMNWLFKEEPTHYSYDDLVRDGKTSWTGVRNPVAQKHLAR